MVKKFDQTKTQTNFKLQYISSHIGIRVYCDLLKYFMCLKEIFARRNFRGKIFVANIAKSKRKVRELLAQREQNQNKHNILTSMYLM